MLVNQYNEEIVKFWTSIIRDGLDQYRQYISDPAIQSRLRTIRIPSKILDGGCGEGYLTRWLAKLGHDVIGIDLSSEFIIAAQGYRENTEKYLQADLTNLFFESNSFDCVVSNFVLMELEYPEQAINEISRVLHKNGRFIFQVLHPIGSIYSAGDLNFDYFKKRIFSKTYTIQNQEAPRELNWYHHPLSTYTKALYDNKFNIVFMDEPSPISNQNYPDSIVSQIYKPRSLLIDALKL